MNKTELLPKLQKIFDELFLDNGYRYIKSQEKYQQKTNELRLSFYPNVTYWSSSNSCMVSPLISVHVDKVEDYISSFSNQKINRHSPTLTLLSDNIKTAKVWSISNEHDLNLVSKEISNTATNILLPLIESWSTPHGAAIAAIENHKSLFHSELHRLTILFAFYGAYKDNEILEKTINSVNLDSIDRSQSQLDPYYRGILIGMRFYIPEIAGIKIDL